MHREKRQCQSWDGGIETPEGTARRPIAITFVVPSLLLRLLQTKRARAILGQSRSTIDLRETILDGGILLVSTAQGSVGRDVSALVGASLLNLVDSVIREQGDLPLEKRRGALVVVDEMQSLPGVDYKSMLSELGKFGASFILATQSLAKLDDLSHTMRDTLLANVGCLAVFQVSGSDARQLVWELGKDRVTEDDITGFHAINNSDLAKYRNEPVLASTIPRTRLQAGMNVDALALHSRRQSPCAVFNVVGVGLLD